MKSRFIAYLPAALLSIVIFFTVDLAYAIRKVLVEYFGDGLYNTAYLVLALVTAYALRVIIKSREKRLLRVFLLSGLCGLFVLSLVRLTYGIEKIHYIEYGFLSFLGFRAFSKDFRTLTAGLLSVLLAYIVGLTDEFLQHLNPSRVGEFSDVVLNLKSGLLGVLFALVCRKPSSLDFSFCHRDAAGLLSGLFLSVSCAFFFVETVHGYGFLIRDSGGLSFYSSRDSSSLSAINDSLRDKKSVSAVSRAVVDNEASRHIVQRDFYLQNRFYAGKDEYFIEYGKTYRENAILEKYYGYFLDSTGARWDMATRDLVANQQWGDTAWHSRVKETVITGYPPVKVRCLFIGGMLLCLTPLLLLFLSVRKRGWKQTC